MLVDFNAYFFQWHIVCCMTSSYHPASWKPFEKLLCIKQIPNKLNFKLNLCVAMTIICSDFCQTASLKMENTSSLILFKSSPFQVLSVWTAEVSRSRLRFSFFFLFFRSAACPFAQSGFCISELRSERLLWSALIVPLPSDNLSWSTVESQSPSNTHVSERT